MERRTVMSREYKVMLRPNRFRGNEEALLEAAKGLWRDFSTTVKKKTVVDTEGDLTQIATRRLITFYDTRDQLLNEARYIFRERRGVDGSERDVTLKFRHPDRYVAQDRNMDASASTEAKTKFEEDIKSPFLSLYSFSTRLKIDKDMAFKALGDIRRLFADVSRQDRQVSGLHEARPGQWLHRTRTGARRCEPAGRQDTESGCRVRAHRLV